MSQASFTRKITALVFIVLGVACLAGYLVNSDSEPESSAQAETLVSNSVAPNSSEVAEPVAGAVSESENRPVWEAWPKPQLAFMMTGEQHGYFEPCGCTSNQLGGMSRRADLLAKLETAGWSVRGVDVGGLSRRTSRQAAIKIDTTLRALHRLKYVGVAVGTEELQLGVENLLEVHMNMSNLDAAVPFVCANLSFLDDALEGFPAASRIVEASGLKIGVTSVLSKKLSREVLPMPEVAWKEPAAELKKILAEFDEQEVDLRILLSHGSVEDSNAFAEQFPAFELVLTARGIGDPDPEAAPQKVGNTMIIEAGRKGKYVGVLGVYPNHEPMFRYQLVSLERDDFEDTPEMIKLMEDYQTQLKDSQMAKEDTVGAAHPSGATFVGADACGECHTEAYEIWKKTPHAHAFESLDPVHKHAGYERLNGVNRTYDPECLACHVAGWDPVEYIRFESGFLNEEFASSDEEKMLHKLLGGNQCENCHGPGSQHIEQVAADAEDSGKSVRVTLEQARKGMCEKCHDADNSPKFEFDAYWKDVEHYGLD